MGLARPVWGRLGPNEKFNFTLIQCAYYALTFSEEIRKKYQTVFEWVSKRSILGNLGLILTCLDPTREQDFSQTCGFHRKLRNIIFFHFKQKKYTSMVFVKTPKTLFLPKNGKIGFFPKKSGCHFFALTSCKKIRKKLLSKFWEKVITDLRTDWLAYWPD